MNLLLKPVRWGFYLALWPSCLLLDLLDPCED